MNKCFDNNGLACGCALVDLGSQDPRVVVLEADLGKCIQSQLFQQQYPGRYFNMGIAEGNMMGVAAGLAASGKIPFAHTFCVFASMRAVEQIRNSIAYPKLNVKILASNSGIAIGADGVTHQAIEDMAIMQAIPNMTVIVPSDPVMTAKVIHAAANYPGPVYIRIGRDKTTYIYDENLSIEFGKSLEIRPGHDVTLVAFGNMVSRCLLAATTLAGEGISARVVDMYSMKPLDRETIVKAARETGCIVTAEDHNVVGGLGSAVADVLSQGYWIPMRRIGIPDVFAQSAEAEDLLEHYGLTAENIAAAARQVIEKKQVQPVSYF